MFIIIKDSNKISKYEICDDVIYKGIHIYQKKDEYYIELKNGYYFDDNSKSKILEIKSYNIKTDKNLYNISIYVYENSNGINDFSLYRKASFIIANSDSANIICKDQYLKKYYLSVNGNQLKSNFDVIVNNYKISETQLKTGDIIEYLGIKIIYFDEFIYINKFNIEINIDPYETIYSTIKYKEINRIDSFYIPASISKLEVDDINEYEQTKKPNNVDFIKSIIPNLIMCLSMGIMAYLNYINNSRSNDVLIVSYIVMPISMMLTGLIVPSIFILFSNNDYRKAYLNSKNKYLTYLDEYENSLNNKVSKYIDDLNSHFFSLINSQNTMFYASKKSTDFLKFSIGKTKTNISLKYKLTDDDEINSRLKAIFKRTDSIENYPVYLDIKDKRSVTIVSKRADKNYFFNKFILETAYKHHYEDINIAIYCKNQNMFNMFYNLPHLFIGNLRLTLSNIQDLQILDQMSIEKPLILFMYDRINYSFTNQNIHLIYFSSDISDCIKDSEVVVEYLNNSGYIYLDNKTKFSYIPEDINFKEYFRYIGKHKSLVCSKNITNLNNIYNNYVYDNHSLQANFSYNDDNLIAFDLHETKQGPHGLIGGSTGSGKSELIVSLLLSLALKYPPDYLNMVIIDYKGGGIKESLSYNNVPIPHIVASLSNLNDYGLERLIISLNNECKRRQLLFKKLSNLSNSSIMNLDDYIDNNTYNLDKISHLLIVVDEFAELKKNNPEQIKELISISRIGRSLGVHLILATQKPAGVIDDEIWSNSRFKIALKVFDEKDSSDIIKSKDAAYLTDSGSFYMLVDGGLIKGQAIYTKSDMYGNDPYKISLLDNKLQIIKTYKKENKKTLSYASYYCKKIIESTINKYQHKEIEYLPPVNKDRGRLTNGKCLCFGEIDDYINSSRGLLAYDIFESMLIYTSRPHEINSILNSLNENYRHSVVIANDIYKGKYISDSITYDNSEDIEYLFNNLLNNRNNNLTLVIEDLNCLLSYDETYIEKLSKLIKRKDSLNLSIVCLTYNSQISFKIINLFKTKVMININDNSDLSYFYGTRGQYKGKSYFYLDSPITFVPIKIEEYHKQSPIIAAIIKTIPDVINPDIKDGKFLLGYDEYTKDPIYMNSITLVSYNESLFTEYCNSYSDIKTITYKNSLRLDENEQILWLGPGIFNQRIFVTGLKDDLNDSQGILIVNNKRTIIRSLNNV